FALLSGEAGLHRLTRGEGRRASPPRGQGGGGGGGLPGPPGDEAGGRGGGGAAPGAAGRGGGRRRPGGGPPGAGGAAEAPAWGGLRAGSDRPGAEAVSRLRPLLRARLAVEGGPAPEGRPPVVRRYCLGPAPLVRDVRSGKSSGRVEQVFDGELDRFLMPMGS